MILKRSIVLNLAKTLVLNGVATGSYFLLGLLGLLFRLPADPVGMIAPTSGFALAVTLVFGVRLLPAVFLGNFLVNLWFFNFKPEYFNFYVASALGASLSAWFGTYLAHRLIGFPNPLLESRNIILFYCFVGPVSCLISTLIGITVMHEMGIVPMKTLTITFLSGWFADIFGILIFTPLVQISLAEPRPIWHRRRLTVGLPVFLTFSLVVILSFYLKTVALDHYTEQLKEKAVSLSLELKHRLELNLASLKMIRNFILINPQVLPPDEFEALIKQTLLPFKEAKSVAWVNLTETKGEKSQFIRILDTQGNTKTEIVRVLPTSIRQRLLTDSSLFNTGYLETEQNSLKWVLPVLKESGGHNPMGIITATISFKNLLQLAFDKLNMPRCAVTITTVNESISDLKTIYSDIARSSYALYEAVPVEVAGQKWFIHFYHDWALEKPDANWPIWPIILSGFWFTGVLGIVLMYLTGRNFRTEAIIEERTQILIDTKIAAEKANETKNQFLAKISHELRTPLNGIFGFTQLLEKRPTLNSEDRNQVAIIKQCSDDLLRLIDDILDISAIETQQIKLDVREFNLPLMLTDSIRICKLKADQKGIKLFFENTCPYPKFLGDEKRIRQILVNLIDNAIKYTSEGRVAVNASYHDGLLKITVADTGSGIAQQDLERIFVPFIQVNADNFSREGIGLGLPITKELVHLMAGNLLVSSEIGQGSTFTVQFPLPVVDERPAQTEMDKQMKETAAAEGNYVLVVDDSDINLLFLVSMLEQLGCKVDTARNGEEALILLGQHRYDFALVDINMPILNGIDMVKRLRSQHNKIKLVAVSAYADESKINEALDAGFDQYITKPVKEYQLVELIQASKE